LQGINKNNFCIYINYRHINKKTNDY